MAIVFRAARPSDIEALLPMAREFRTIEGMAWDELSVRAALVGLMVRSHAGAVWVLDVDGRAVGYLVVTFGYSLEYHGRDAFIDELYVEDAYRRRGFGRRALQVAETYCRTHEAHTLHLVVRPGNKAARALYQRYGFAATDRLLLSRAVSLPRVMCVGGPCDEPA